jgi:hypothetical protein
MRCVECLAQELSRFGAPIASSEEGAEVSDRACSLQAGVTTLGSIDRLAEQEHSAVAAGNNAGGAQRCAECARGTECASEPDVLLREARSRLVVTEGELRERGLRSPGNGTGGDDLRSRQECADCKDVVEPFRDSSLSDPQPPAGKAKQYGDERSAFGL